MLEDAEECDDDGIGLAGEVGWGVIYMTLSSTALESDWD